MPEYSEPSAVPKTVFTPDSAEKLDMAIRAVQTGLKAVEVVYSSHPRWPLPRQRPSKSSDNHRVYSNPEPTLPEIQHTKRLLHISVLDSSFNPPTLAHLALARSKPPNTSFSQAVAPTMSAAQHTNSGPKNSPASNDYDARLLLLSVRNADKALKAGDASFTQRLEMMTHLALHLEQDIELLAFPTETSSTASLRAAEAACRDDEHASGNVAVAIIDEPTFVRKSSVLREYLRDRVASLCHAPRAGDSSMKTSTVSAEDLYIGLEGNRPPDVRLSFIMGFDTLERFLAPRYYGGTSESMHTALDAFFSPPPRGNGSKVVCAWRGSAKALNARTRNLPQDAIDSDEEKRFRETLQLAEPFIQSGGIDFTDLTDWEMQLSSSEVRSKRAASAQEWTDLVPRRVTEYIDRYKLYLQ